jgi:hypothetical protein
LSCSRAQSIRFLRNRSYLKSAVLVRPVPICRALASREPVHSSLKMRAAVGQVPELTCAASYALSTLGHCFRF